jgi:hypothetical protein
MFERNVPRSLFRPGRDEVTENGENTKNSFAVCV